MPIAVAGYAIAQTDGQLETLGKATGMAKEAVAVKKGDTATAQAVQKALQKLIDDGTYMNTRSIGASSPGPSTSPRSTRPM